MFTMISTHEFILVETECSAMLDLFDSALLNVLADRPMLWKNEGEFAFITVDKIKETWRVHEELSHVPEGQLSTAGFPCIFWDDCLPVSQEIAAALLGEERDFYRDADKPQDGSHS